jgi:endoglucanase
VSRSQQSWLGKGGESDEGFQCAARWLASRDAALGAVYRESALRAMAWAESKVGERPAYPHQVRDDRNLAAAELFRLTGENVWQALFLKEQAFP